MKKLSVLGWILLFSWSHTILFAQSSKTCACEVDEKKAKDDFNAFADKKQDKQAKKLAYRLIKSKNPSCVALGCDFLVSLFHRMGEMDSAMVYLSIAEKAIKKLDCNKKAILEFYSSKSLHCFMTNNIEGGIQESLRALELALVLNDFRNQAYLYSNLSLSFYRLNQYEKGKLYASSLMKVIPKLTDPYVKIDMLRYIAESYYNYYKGTKSEKSLDSINVFASKALEASRNMAYHESSVTCYILKHYKPYMQKNFKESLVYLDSALSLLQSVKVYNATQSKYRINLLKTDIYLETNQAEFAIQSADSSLKFAKMEGEKAYMVSSYDRLYKANKQAGNLAKSIAYLETYLALRDSVQNLERTSIVNELEQKYNKVKNEKIIREQNHKNNLLTKQNEIDGLQIRFLWVGVILILLLLLFIVFLFRQRSLKEKQKLIETEQRLNRSRINPHFFFNILASLQKLLMTSEDKKTSIFHLARFSKIMRQTLESSYNDNVSIAQEIDFLSEYLELQKLRKNSDFDFSIVVDQNLDSEEFFVPSMLLQPFIENAIEHGFSSLSKRGILTISFKLVNKELVVSIEDNGVGILNTEQKDKNHISRATQIIRERLELLNRKYKSNARFTIQQSSNGEGTLVHVYLPDSLEANFRKNQIEAN